MTKTLNRWRRQFSAGRTFTRGAQNEAAQVDLHIFSTIRCRRNRRYGVRCIQTDGC